MRVDYVPPRREKTSGTKDPSFVTGFQARKSELVNVCRRVFGTTTILSRFGLNGSSDSIEATVV